MEDLVPAQWTGQEATFEPNLEKHANGPFLTRHRHAYRRAHWTLGFVVLASVPLSLWTLAPRSSLGDRLFPFQSMWFVWSGLQTLAPE